MQSNKFNHRAIERWFSNKIDAMDLVFGFHYAESYMTFQMPFFNLVGAFLVFHAIKCGHKRRVPFVENDVIKSDSMKMEYFV